MKTILFVCAGNKIRSPAAEAILQKMVNISGRSLEFRISSAGVFARGAGEGTDVRMVEAAQKRGYVAHTVARKLKAADFYLANAMYTMDGAIHKHVSDMAPKNSMFQTANILPMDTKDVPDPYNGTLSDFDAVVAQIELACAAILKGA